MRNWIRGEASERPKVTAGGRGGGGYGGRKQKKKSGWIERIGRERRKGEW